MSIRKRRSLLQIWSVRYFLIMILSISAVGAATLYGIQRLGVSEQYRDMMQIAQKIGDQAAENGGKLPEEALSSFLADQTERTGLDYRPIMFILDRAGHIVQQFPPSSPPETGQLTARLTDIRTGGSHVITLKRLPGRSTLAVAVHPFETASAATEYALYLTPKLNPLQGLLRFRLLRFTCVTAFFLIGWGIVYLMTRQMVRPIQEAVGAAKQIVSGDYNVRLDKERSAKEVHELMQAFKEMGERLSRLETLRTQLLAGVTHELKTPITSISGLIQAVRDGVVSGAEAEAFLDNSLKQSNRLQKMVEDLLDFNSFASQTVAVRPELFDLRAAMRDILDRWRFSREPQGVEVVLETASESRSWQALSDPTRIEQIVVNLLNNAQDAMPGGGRIRVRLTAEAAMLHIQVQDRGHGIPAGEQADIFEPFYRGRDKKRRVRGLGLGLPFSKLIARSLGGDLVLADSGPEGTTFTLSIPA